MVGPICTAVWFSPVALDQVKMQMVDRCVIIGFGFSKVGKWKNSGRMKLLASV